MNNTVKIGSSVCPVLRVGAVVVGSGAAAFSAALALENDKDYMGGVLLVTEGMKMGTSRNTGSDKQTYYKLSTAVNITDSARKMAEDYFACGSMHGDLALTEAAGSLRGFFRLVSLGVPFPHDRFGEYTGYRTDHDEYMRATSCGPLTSKYMTEALERAARSSSVPMLDGYRAVEVLKKDGRACGIVCISDSAVTDDNKAGLCVILAGAVIWATGGPSAVYTCSVYPESQNCSLGAPLMAGATAANLTESQYGIASLKFRWNLSGSYQQVIPRYVSVDKNGVEHEFLSDTFGADQLCHAIFSKGYEWPFDPDKLTKNSRSSLVDMAVYAEVQRGRRVYMDFRRNPSTIERGGLSESTVGKTAYEYLKNCSSLGETPIIRLCQMNEKAYKLYLDHGIDLEREMLEISVCAQHLNGGLEVSAWYENPSLPGFYPVGECAGVFGIKRPGGSALNSTQVGSLRAAEKVAAMKVPAPETADGLDTSLSFAEKVASLLSDGENASDAAEIIEERKKGGRRYDECAAFIRDREKIERLKRDIGEEIRTFFSENRAKDHRALVELMINYDTLVTRYVMLSSIEAYIDDGGLSRGSYLITDGGKVPENVETDTAHRSKVLVTAYDASETAATVRFDPVRPIPETDNWFETVYNAFGKKEMYE